ncbi:hypothetical protein VCUG_00514 [Vavraia culicis subsp. floridensis]|uniref:RING-CH-type domain-containing protein n=1 Tax=Vavraia culicis (isolate floridensis) TaxID=948595 RepID=L2GW89_VAVCU|nr:uncharacterized protein VCUG_00514 [Vavraia culicis subsp. floridensis]ELA47931.1 hypothetical protein VCUG_00514 [Vavraia culicis subsp. floridensis]
MFLFKSRQPKHKQTNLSEVKTVSAIDPSERCKICYMYNNPIDSTCDLISPCGCKGSIKYVHKTCLRLWRFKGKNLREIKTCEQCFCEYRVDEDLMPNKIVVQMITVVATVFLFVFFHFAINIVVESLSFIIDEIFFNSKHFHEPCYERLSYAFNGREYANGAMTRESDGAPANDTFIIGNKKFYLTGKDTLLKLSFMETSVIVLIFYQVLFNYGLVSTINLFFTLWRIVNFEYKIDYFFLFVICIYYFKKLYRALYLQIDHISYFVMNSNNF